MEWFKNLSLGNKISLLGLIVSIFGVTLALIQFAQSPPSQGISNEQKAVTSLKTTGKNSPIVNNAKGNVEINFGEKDDNN